MYVCMYMTYVMIIMRSKPPPIHFNPPSIIKHVFHVRNISLRIASNYSSQNGQIEPLLASPALTSRIYTFTDVKLDR